MDILGSGIVDIGEGSPFSNPFKPHSILTADYINILSESDYKKFVLNKKSLTYADTYYLFAQYTFPEIDKDDNLVDILAAANDYKCNCKMGKWCHSNIYKKFYLNSRHEIQNKQPSESIFKRAQRRRSRWKRT